MKKEWVRFAPIGLWVAGIGALISAGLYIVQREFNLYLQIGLGVTILGLAVFILLDTERVRIALLGRQARHGSNLLVMSLAFIGILVVVNFFVFKNSKRWDLTEDQQNTLAAETLDTLAALPGDVTVVGFFTPERSIESASNLLDDYKFHSDGKLSYKFIDPVEDPVAAQAAEITQDGTLVFQMGSQKELVTSVTEREFTGALIRLISGDESVIYFLTGHGEFSAEDTGDRGYNTAKRILESKNYVVQSLNLLSATSVPGDATAIVIAGPVQPLEPSEVDMLAEYMAQGGSLIAMLDSPVFTEIGNQEDYLADYLQQTWGIVLSADVVVDPTSFLGLFVPVGAGRENHPIAEKMQGFATAFPTARSVQITEVEGVTPVELLATVNQDSWAETDLENVLVGAQPSFDPGTDLGGPVPIAVVAENTTAKSRVAVFGDVDFAVNANFDFSGNGTLFINTVDWAAEQEELINLTPQTATQRFMPPPQPYMMNLIFLLVVFVLPGSVLVAGVVVWFQKRRRG
jgi:ABC-type uncharacterized transport system involved in gliding motility auxiliary subunit